ncbi:HAD family hydrolase [Streptomyces sp. NPDC004393]|uniref:HAD family hydrolase n=1 Tax=Streptomyces sp. NPDC004533 TaxID=3154278 RepID=UPI0033ACF12D
MTGALLLDLDGTLLDTPGAIARTLRSVLFEVAGRTVGTDAVRATVGRPLDTSVAALLDRDPADPVVADAVARYREAFAATVLPRAREIVLPGVVEGLTLAREAGAALAVATSKVRASTEPLLRAAGLDGFFDTVACHDMVDRGKPHPDLALYAADALAVPPEVCVVVGDSGDDMRMARGAGMRALGVTTGVASAETLAEAGAHAVYDRFDELVRDALTHEREVVGP